MRLLEIAIIVCLLVLLAVLGCQEVPAVAPAPETGCVRMPANEPVPCKAAPDTPLPAVCAPFLASGETLKWQTCMHVEPK